MSVLVLLNDIVPKYKPDSLKDYISLGTPLEEYGYIIVTILFIPAISVPSGATH